MSKQKELMLIEKLYEGDANALEEILHEGVRLSVVMASKYTNNVEERVFYSRMAIEGFYKALYLYKNSESRGKHKFTTYATYFMNKAIEKEIKSQA